MKAEEGRAWCMRRTGTWNETSGSIRKGKLGQGGISKTIDIDEQHKDEDNKHMLIITRQTTTFFILSIEATHF